MSIRHNATLAYLSKFSHAELHRPRSEKAAADRGAAPVAAPSSRDDELPVSAAQRRQPAESAHRQVAPDRSQGLLLRRSHPRHRHRRQGRYLPLLAKLAGEGLGVIWVSSELPELLANAHRILVLHEGRCHGHSRRRQRRAGRHHAPRHRASPTSHYHELWNYLKRHGQPFIGLLLILILGDDPQPARHGRHQSSFSPPGNLTDVLLQQSEIGIIALAMTFVIIGAGIDLSVGSVLAFSACVSALMMMVWNPKARPCCRSCSPIAASLAGRCARRRDQWHGSSRASACSHLS